MNRDVEFSFEGFHERLTRGEDVALLGAADGKVDYPAAGATAPSPFQYALQARAREEANKVASWVQDQIQAFIDHSEGNPFALPGQDPVERCRTIRQTTIEEIEEAVADRRQQLIDARNLAWERRRQRDFDYQRAGGDPPASRLPSLYGTLLSTSALCGLEGVGAYVLLAGAVELVTAFLSGLAIPGLMTLLGGLSAFFSLHPADKRERGSRKQKWKRAAAIGFGLAALIASVCAAAWRTALIAGQDGTNLDFTSLADFGRVAESWEAWALAGVSVTAFVVAFFELTRYFDGFVRQLRASDEAYRDADDDRLRLHDEAADLIKETAFTGRQEADNVVRFAAEWAKTTKVEAQRAKGVIYQANRYLENLENAVLAVNSEYRAGNEKMRMSSPPAWQPIQVFDDYFATPPQIEEAPKIAARNSARWSEAARVETAAIGEAELKALAYIDGLVDLHSPNPPQPATPAPALPWRAAPV